MKNHKGFSIVEVVIVLAIVGLIALIGWRVWEANQFTTDGSQSGTTQSEAAPEINSESDLDTADQTLDATNVEGQEAKQLDSETRF